MIYEITRCNLIVDDETVESFGIKYENVTVNNISINKDYVEGLAARLNKNGASVLHFFEIIEDELA